MLKMDYFGENPKIVSAGRSAPQTSV